MAARIVAVNAPGTLAQGFGGEPTAFEICLIVKIGDSEEWSVLEAFDEGRSGTGSSGSVLYKKEAGAARSGGRRCHSLPIAQRGGGTRGSVWRSVGATRAAFSPAARAAGTTAQRILFWTMATR